MFHRLSLFLFLSLTLTHSLLHPDQTWGRDYLPAEPTRREVPARADRRGVVVVFFSKLQRGLRLWDGFGRGEALQIGMWLCCFSLNFCVLCWELVDLLISVIWVLWDLVFDFSFAWMFVLQVGLVLWNWVIKIQTWFVNLMVSRPNFRIEFSKILAW